MTTTLTPEEKAQFTPINSLAFDLARKEAKSERIPCWLCTTEEVRQQYRDTLFASLREQMGKHYPSTINEYTTEKLEQRITDAYTSHDLLMMFAIWEQAELESKAAREAGNAQAFFVPEPGIGSVE